MKTKNKTHPILKVTLLSFIPTIFLSVSSIAAETESPDPKQSSKYLDAVLEFADNVLEYGRDTYGPKKTSLFVDGLNINTHEPVKWIAPNGDRWILSNLASQQNLFRTLDGLTRITGDPKYRQGAIDAIKYAFENLRSPNGLLYWGGHIAYDVGGDKICARGPSNNHELKCHFPYYELMWQVDPAATRRFIESFWAAHVLDWSNLDMNRHGHTERTLEMSWDRKFEGGPVFFWGSGLTFLNTGSDLFYSAAMLSSLSGQEQLLVWAKHMAKRYVETRNPKTGIGGYQYSQCSTAWCCGPSILGDRAQYQFGDDFEGHFVVEGTLFPCYGNTPPVQPWISEFLLGERLGAEGKEFTQWALEELTAWGKAAYRKEDNSWIPMLTDGTTMEGYVCKKDGYFGPKGRIIKAGRAGPSSFWTYALAFRITSDPFMWEMTRCIAKGNNLGDIGTDMEARPNLEMDTDCSNTYALLGFLELYKKQKNTAFLKMARRIGDNILSNQFYKGFFVPSKRHIYTRFDCYEPLVLLQLYSATQSEPDSVPWVWPSSSFLACEYYGRGTAYDTSLIYTLTDSVEPPMTPQAAAAVGDLDELRILLSREISAPSDRIATLNDILLLAAEAGHVHVVEFLLDEGAQINSGTTTALHYAVQNDHRNVVELLLAKGADVNAKDGAGQTPVDLAIRRNRKEIVELLAAKGAEVTTIHTAAGLGDANKVKEFLEQGTDVNAKDGNGQTALHIAAGNNHKDIADLLLKQGADANARDRYNYTPLYYALWDEDKDMISFLISKGADVNLTPEKDYTPLHYAVWMEDVDIVKLLVDKGAKFDVKVLDDWTAFRYAAWQGSRDMVELFISKGAEATGLYVAAFTGDLSRVKEFIENGTDVDNKDEAGWTALYWAACAGQTEVAEFLIDNDADISATDTYGRSLIHQTAQADSVKLVELLISKDADANAKDMWGNTPLHITSHRDVAELIIAKGADVNARAQNNMTPLHRAAISGQKDVVEILLANGADVTIKDGRGRTAYDLAKQRGHTEIVNLLQKDGAKE